MEGQHGRDAHREQAAEHIAGVFGNLCAAPEYHEVQEQQAYNANKAQFLTYHGKDKVRVVLRQKVQLTLRAFEKTFTKEHAGTDGNLGLDDMIARAQRVHIRVHKDHNAHLLIVLQKVPEQRQHGNACRKESA